MTVFRSFHARRPLHLCESYRLRAARLSVLALLSLLTACTNLDQREQPLSLGDEAAYATWVHPYVELRCSSLDCHGDNGRPLRLYGGGGLRLRAELRDMFVDDEEIRANVRAFAGISPDITEPAEHRALLAGLAVSAGGLAHVGGDVWPDSSAAGYQCILAWLERRSDAPAAQAACLEAAEEFAH